MTSLKIENMKKSRPNIGWSTSVRDRENDYSSYGFLVVDDEEGIRDILCDALRTCGAQHVQRAGNGEQALARLSMNQAPCDVIISDCHMAPMNGLQLLKTVREGGAKTIRPDIPFIMITGHGDIPLVKKAQELKVSGFLAKPVSLEKLTTAVSKALAALSAS